MTANDAMERYKEVERDVWIAQRIASLFYFAFFLGMSALDAYVIHSGLSTLARLALALAIGLFFFPLVGAIVRRHARNKYDGKNR